MVQQLTSEGNLRIRVRREVPAGDMASTICSWSRTMDTKYVYSAVGLPSVCKDLSRWRSTCIFGIFLIVVQNFQTYLFSNTASSAFSLCQLTTRIFSQSSAFSSAPKMFGTSPEFNILLTSSKNPSSLIYKTHLDILLIVRSVS